MKMKNMTDPSPSSRLFSPIWKLISASSSFINNNINWTLGNGTQINIQTESIMNHPPLQEATKLRPLQLHLSSVNVYLLGHISKSKDSRLWSDWSLENILINIMGLMDKQKEILRGCAHCYCDADDKLGWKSHVYTVKEIYEDLLFSMQIPPNSSL